MSDENKSAQEVKDQARVVTELWEAAQLARQDLTALVKDERDFMFRLKHYKEETSPQERDQHRIRPRGRQLFSKHRHKVGQFSRTAIYLDVRPDSPESTAEDAEIAQALMESEIHDPMRHYHRVRRRVFSAALASRVGAMKLTVNYNAKGGPRVEPRVIDWENLVWAKGFHDPDDPQCPWVIERVRARVPDVKAMGGEGRGKGWKNTEKVRADKAPGQKSGSQVNADQPLSQVSGSGQPTNDGEDAYDDATTLLMCWYTRDDSKTERTVDRTLLADDWHLACPACGYTEPLPGTPPNACPQCGMHMGVVTSTAEKIEELAFPDGRLVVVATSTSDGNPKGTVLYDDKWPHPMRGVPYFTICGYEDPFEQVGLSDVAVDRDLQCVENALTRRVYEQIMRSPSIIISSDELKMPNSDQPFEITDDPISLAIWQGQGPPAITFFQPAGMPNGWSTFYSVVNASLRGDMGTSDIGLRGTELKDVTASTAELAAKTGEIPVDDHIIQFQEREGPFLGKWLDIKRDLMKERTAVPIPTDGGGWSWIWVRGEQLAGFHFMVTASPDWKSVDQERAQAAQIFLQLMMTAPQYADIVAEVSGLPPSVGRKFLKRFKEQQLVQQQAMLQAQMAGGSTPGGSQVTAATNGASAPAARSTPHPAISGMRPGMVPGGSGG